MQLLNFWVSNRPGLVLLFLLMTGINACGKTGQAPDADQEPHAGGTAGIDPGRVTVSGVSSGGYMAVQAHIAMSDRISGAAAISAGPYHCAGGSVKTAIGPCMRGEGIAVEPLLEFVRQQSAAGEIADIAGLASARAWVFHSPADAVVSPKAGQALTDFYAALLPAENLASITAPHAAHGWPTLSNGEPCGQMSGDFINSCNFDAAGELLAFLFGALDNPRQENLSGDLQPIDLSQAFPAGSAVADDGFVYVPASCESNMTDCRLHIAFHGCRQGAEFVEDRFARQIGLNEWADSNNIVVVYPQIEKSMFNPQGCWDWWGYSGDNYDLADGAQLTGVRTIIDAFARGQLLR